MSVEAVDQRIKANSVELSTESNGSGTPVILLHGLTTSRYYVVMGSKYLERNGHFVVKYDARGHGKSSPSPGLHDYTYEELAADLLFVMDFYSLDSAVLAGVSMGSHTVTKFALDYPERVKGLVIITPAFDPLTVMDEARMARWQALAAGLRSNGIEGFIEVYALTAPPEPLRSKILTVVRQQLSKHKNLLALADVLESLPRSCPFDSFDQLQAITARTAVIGSRDELDRYHPFALAQKYVDSIPGAQFFYETEGRSPLAWQGGQVSKIIADIARG